MIAPPLRHFNPLWPICAAMIGRAQLIGIGRSQRPLDCTKSPVAAFVQERRRSRSEAMPPDVCRIRRSMAVNGTLQRRVPTPIAASPAFTSAGRSAKKRRSPTLGYRQGCACQRRSGAIPSSSLRSINSRNFLRAKALCTPRIGINHCNGSDLTPDEFSQRSIIALASLEIWSKARAAEPTSLRLLTRS